MAFVRIRLDIADDILQELRALAHARRTPFDRIVNDALRAGLAAGTRAEASRRYRQRAFEMGEPLVNLDHALRIAGALEDQENARKL